MMVVEPMVMGRFFLLLRRLTRPDWLSGVSQGVPSVELMQPSWPEQS